MGLYNAEVSAGSLMPLESRQLAGFLLCHPDEGAWTHAIKVENILQKNSPATALRQAKLIRRRLDLLDEEGWILVRDSSPELAIQMLLLAAIRHSQLLGDYLIDVYRGQQRRLETHLNAQSWGVFLHECEQRDPSVQEWQASTRAKLLQVVLRILAEARYIESTKSLKITPPLLHPLVLKYLTTRQDHYAREAMERTR